MTVRKPLLLSLAITAALAAANAPAVDASAGASAHGSDLPPLAACPLKFSPKSVSGTSPMSLFYCVFCIAGSRKLGSPSEAGP